MGERNIRSQRQVKNFRGGQTETHRKAEREAEVLGTWPTSLVAQMEAQLPTLRMKKCWGPHTHLQPARTSFPPVTDRSLGDKCPAGEVRVGV